MDNQLEQKELKPLTQKQRASRLKPGSIWKLKVHSSHAFRRAAFYSYTPIVGERVVRIEDGETITVTDCNPVADPFRSNMRLDHEILRQVSTSVVAMRNYTGELFLLPKDFILRITADHKFEEGDVPFKFFWLKPKVFR